MSQKKKALQTPESGGLHFQRVVYIISIGYENRTKRKERKMTMTQKIHGLVGLGNFPPTPVEPEDELKTLLDDAALTGVTTDIYTRLQNVEAENAALRKSIDDNEAAFASYALTATTNMLLALKCMSQLKGMVSVTAKKLTSLQEAFSGLNSNITHRIVLEVPAEERIPHLLDAIYKRGPIYSNESTKCFYELAKELNGFADTVTGWFEESKKMALAPEQGKAIVKTVGDFVGLVMAITADLEKYFNSHSQE
jgi:hypothetical protein